MAAKKPKKCQRCRKEPAVKLVQGLLVAWHACAKCIRARTPKEAR
jgi:hypothetical protein